MRPIITLAVLACTFLFACKKDSFKEQTVNHSGDKYFFKYKVNGKPGGYSFQTCVLDAAPTSKWSEVSMATEVLSGTFPNLAYGAGSMSASERGIAMELASNCGTSGKPDCFVARLATENLAPGTYGIENGLRSFSISTGIGSSRLLDQTSADHDENITVNIRTVGPVGGIVTGDFTGTLRDVDAKVVPVEGSFSVVRTY